MSTTSGPVIRLGSRIRELRAEESVFINCPFDAGYQETFDAVVLAVACSGFVPRAAIESEDASQPRMQRIFQTLNSSQYSLHDLSRCKGGGELNLARFNMPLELGMAMARRFADERSESESTHEWLPLVPHDHEYSHFISDLAGYDPKRYDGTPAGAVACVIPWLATRASTVGFVKPTRVAEALPRFQSLLAQLRTDWEGQPPWAAIVFAALDLAESIQT